MNLVRAPRPFSLPTESSSNAATARKPPAKGGQASQITRNGGEFAYESPDRQWIYYLKPTTPDPEFSSLWKMPVGGGEEREVLGTVYDHCFDFVKEGIYFIANQAALSCSSLVLLQAGSAQQRRLLQRCLPGVFSVSPDGRWVLYSEFVPFRANLMLVDGYR
jgi:hypothetical protein